MTFQSGLFSYMKQIMQNEYHIEMSDRTKENLYNIMTNNFATGSGKQTYRDCVFLETDGDDYRISREYLEMLADQNFRSIVQELITFGIKRYKQNYAERYQNTNFQLYSKYTYEDVCRLLDWEKGEVALNIGGYKYDKATKTYPVFINYDKEDDIQDTVRYEDRFMNQNTLIAISKSGRSLSSEDVYTALHAEELGVHIAIYY